MLKSMTGYGKALCESTQKKYTIEIKSLNSKQLDLQIKIPSWFREKEIEIRNEISNCLERGKVDFSIRIDNADFDKTTKINKNAFVDYYSQLSAIANETNLNVQHDSIFRSIILLPDVFKSEQMELDEKEWIQIQASVKTALAAINEFRQQEGLVLEKDIINRINMIQELSNQIEKFEKQRIVNVRNRIQQSLDDYIKNLTVDQNRFEQEVIFYLEKIDITEERVRLCNHLKYFIETVNLNESTGRKLGFISQEIGREINTIGSKANDSDIQRIVVQMKDELEKIKEQLMNVL